MSISTKRLDQIERVHNVLMALRASVEGDRGDWMMVYLDNAARGFDRKQFRACLASLSERGLYKVVDGYAWGKVKMADCLAA